MPYSNTFTIAFTVQGKDIGELDSQVQQLLDDLWGKAQPNAFPSYRLEDIRPIEFSSDGRVVLWEADARGGDE